MTTVQPKHHQPLHNFSFPFLNWGHRVHVTHHHHRRPRHRNSPPTHSSDDQNHTNDVVLPKQKNNTTIIIHDNLVTAGDGDVKPWNLRPRKSVIDPVDGNGNGNSNSNDEYVKKKRLWISLSKEEIEEDVYAFTGSKPVRRPKKRNKTAQKHVDNVFPGLYLVGVSADSYRV